MNPLGQGLGLRISAEGLTLSERLRVWDGRSQGEGFGARGL